MSTSELALESRQVKSEFPPKFLVFWTKGQWEGQAYYHFSEGPRKGKRDVETWKNGELVSSQKYFGEGESITIKNWEDLKKLENHAASTPSEQTENSSPDKDVFYDCISSDCV